MHKFGGLSESWIISPRDLRKSLYSTDGQKVGLISTCGKEAGHNMNR
jgi:hypothetical protein